MFILYFKELCIVGQSFQSWRGKQLAMCESEKPLQDYIDKQKDPKRYYIEKQPCELNPDYYK